MKTRKDKALDAVNAGLAIVPCREESETTNGKVRNAKSPYISQDTPIKGIGVVEAHWYPGRTTQPLIGVVSEACDPPLMFLDIDVKNGKDGYESLRAAGLEIPETPIRYKSSGGNGEHVWFKAPLESIGKVSSRANIEYNGVRLEGVDNRVGNGFVLLPDSIEIPGRDVIDLLPYAPDWLWKDSEKKHASEETRFEGDLQEWLSNRATNDGEEVSQEVQQIINSIPYVMDHDKVRDLQAALVREGAAGNKGSVQGLLLLKSAWLRDEYNVAKYIDDWQLMLEGAIEKFGSPKVDDLAGNPYFNGSNQFLGSNFANDMLDDSAIDAAGAFWSYADGVWSYDPLVHTNKLTNSLVNAYKVSYSGLVQDHLRSKLWADDKMILDKPDMSTVNLQNGTYDCKKGTLAPHDRSKMSTVQLSFDYDSRAECPNFMDWLSQTLPSNEKLALEVIGYMLMNGNPKHKAMLLYGTGRNGKSTFLRVLQNMMGHKNYSSLTLKQLSTERFASVSMYGKLANIAGDIHEGHLNDASTFKAITGGDPITGERKGQQGFTFTPWATMIFSTNEMWSSSDTSDGYLERWLVIPFLIKFAKNGQFDETVLYRESAGIFNAAMAAYREMEERGGAFSSSIEQEMLMHEFRNEADTTLQWLNDEDYLRVAEPTDMSAKTKRTSVYESYRSHRQGKFMLSKAKFYKDLERKGYTTMKTNGEIQMVGIDLMSTSLTWAERDF